MTTGILHDQNLEKQIEKQMGCMTGFLHLFDRNQILNGKRLYATRRLPPPSPHVDSASESEKGVDSPSISTELVKLNRRIRSVPSPELRSPAPEVFTPAESPSKMPLPLPLPLFDFKQGTKSSWKFRETPRLSLDSRAIVDAKGSLCPREIRTDKVNGDNERQHRSPNVIARLMGLEQLPESHPESMMKRAELRRSASESRVNRDLNQYRFVETNYNFQQTQNQSYANSRSNARFQENKPSARQVVTTKRSMKSDEPVKINQRGNDASQWKSPQHRKSFFDSEDFFPEPKQTVSIYGEIEKKLRMRGIDEPSKDLETLKRILDALQLKGLLHSKKSFEEQFNSRNFISHRHCSQMDSPIVLMKPSKSQPTRQRRNGNESPPPSNSSSPVRRRNLNRTCEGMASPRVKTLSSPSRNEGSVTSTSSAMIRKKSLTIETPRRGTDPVEQRRVSSTHSPKVFTRKSSSGHPHQSPRNRKVTASTHPKEKTAVPAEDESSSISDSMSSQTDSERRKMEEFKEGRNLLDRCDKLLQSIAEMNTSELQPSPVSVLDSSFYKDDSPSPSPVLKRSIHFKDQGVELEDEVWGSEISPVKYQQDENSDNSDYIYISDIIRNSNYLPQEKDIFLLLEKQQCHKSKEISKVSTLERRLIFDTVTEILDRNRQLPPWKAILLTSSGNGVTSLSNIWSEFKKIKERAESEDLFEAIFGVLKKDLDGDAMNGWGECHMEKSEAILDIERSIFKDLIGEMIRDLAAVTGNGRRSVSCRKLVF